MEVVVLPSAGKHGITEQDAAHALRNPIRIYDQDDHCIAIGAGRDGALLEVGYVEDEDSTLVIFHAMPARPKYV